MPGSLPAEERPRLHLVVNPASGRGRAGRLLPRVVDQLQRGITDVDVRVHCSTSYQHAHELAQESVAACRPGKPGQRADSLAVMGGDGMAHLGLNACAGTGVPLGVVPAGTGNDFCRGMGLPPRVQPATRAIVDAGLREVDLTRLTGSGGREEYVGSIVSTGYDARVNRRTNAVATSLGPAANLAYAGVALAELATFRPMTYRLVIDGERRELPAMFVAVANAGYFGGGMHVAPRAVVDDGLLDVVLVHPVSRGVLLRLLPTIFRGGHQKHPAVEQLRARQVGIDGDDMFVMGDGEELGAVPVTATVAPRALRLYAPRA